MWMGAYQGAPPDLETLKGWLVEGPRVGASTTRAMAGSQTGTPVCADVRP